jgi:hypothetical protein
VSDQRGDSDTSAPGTSEPDLRALLADVFRTRAAQQQEQTQRGSAALTVLPTRRAALEAMETYAAALEQHGWPLPFKMRAELHLLRSMCGQATPKPR